MDSLNLGSKYVAFSSSHGIRHRKLEGGITEEGLHKGVIESSSRYTGKPENEVCRTMIPPIIGGSHSKDKLIRFQRLNSPMCERILS